MDKVCLGAPPQHVDINIADDPNVVTLTLDLHDNSWLFSYCGKLTVQLSW